MNKYKLIVISPVVLTLIFVCASCGVTKDIYIGSEYPNFVRDESIEIKVGEKFKFIKSDSYHYIVVIEKANEFLDTDSVNLVVGISGRNNKEGYISNPLLVEKKGTGEYFFRVLCREEKIWSAEPSKIKSE